ncbi:MAG: hypothetical protein K0B15_15945 [Lentimicrobium sp.]|nr:hypothetical protein [Lentimicrobium sp.]
MIKKAFLLFAFSLLISEFLPAQEADSIKRETSQESRREARRNKKNQKPLVVVPPDLYDVPFVDYYPAIIFLSPDESLKEAAYL